MRTLKYALLLGAALIPVIALGQTLNQGIQQPYVDLSSVNTLRNVKITTPDNSFFIQNSSDTTKQIVHDASGITTGKTATIAAANTSDATYTLPAATDTLVGRASTDTLTNKTLTTPVISSISNTGTLTLPTSTDTLVGRATTDTLTNKALTAGSTTIVDGSDATKVVAFTASGNTTAKTATIASAVTNNRTITLPDATVTLSSLTGTETLSNKTLTSPVVTGPVPVACGGTCTLGTANLGTYTRLDTAAGSVATLPGATGTGNVYRLYISVATTSNSDKVLTNPITDTIIGTAQGENAGTAKVFVGNAGTYHSLQMPFAGTQPSGGFIGDTIVCTDVANTIWKCDIQYQAGTTPTTPYSASTS